MLDGPKFSSIRFTRLFAVLVALALASFALVSTSPAQAEPKIDVVKKKVDRLFHQAEIASERYNTARVRMADSKKQLEALDADLAAQQRRVDALRGDVATLVVSQYQGQALSTASEVALADNPNAFLDNLSAVTSYNSQRAEVLDSFSVELDRLELRKAAVREETAALAKANKELERQKAAIDKSAAAAKAELDKLEADARAKLLAGDFSGPLPNVPASGRAAAAIKYAMAQVGKRYVYGAAGPNSFDCSGLTMRAWGSAGVGLAHSSRAQIGQGARVSRDALQPGDLVFYYSPISHVGIYIGGGMIVHAANPGAGVRISPVGSMPYSGAVRPG